MALIFSSIAAANDTPVVHGITSSPLTSRQALVNRGNKITLTFDAAPPSSVPFLFELPTSDSEATAILKVWPLAEQVSLTCDPGPPQQARQSHTIGMGSVKENDVWYLRATVPALQVGQTFCFAVAATFTLAATDMVDIAADAARAVGRNLIAGGSCDLPARTMATALSTALDNAGLPVDTTLAGIRASAEFASKAADQCRAFLDARNRHKDARGRLQRFVDALDRLSDTSGLPPLPAGPAPRVTIPNAVNKDTDLLAVANASSTADVLAAGETQVRTRLGDATYSAEDRKKLADWADALAGLRQAVALDAKDPHRKTEIAKALAKLTQLRRRPLSTAEILLDPTKGRYTPSSQLIGQYGGTKVPAATVLAALAAIGAGLRPPASTAVDKWNKMFTKIGQAQDALDKVKSDERSLDALVITTDKAFEAVLPAVFTADGVRAALVVSAPPIRLSNIAGYGTTPSAANYASVDAGALVGFPSGANTNTTWLIPYLGLNLYSTPVDRTIQLSQLTGGTLTRLRQHVSLTIGMTLSQPAIVGRTISAPFAGHYPIAALGYRLTHFTRVTAGVAFYQIADANPASAGQTLAVAPFIGLALDIDVIHLLTQAKL